MQTKKVRIYIISLTIILALVLSVAPATIAQDDDPIVVGSSLSLTGFLSPTAIIHKITGDAFVANLNENGGLLGRQVEWIVLDDESAPDTSAALYERLITEDEVDLLMGPYGTGNITAAMNVAARHGMVFPHHTASLTYAFDYEWQFPAWQIGLNTHITTNDILFDALDSVENPPETIAIVANQFPGSQNLAHGNDVLEPGGAEIIAEQHGYDVVLVVDYPLGNTDFGSIAAQIRDADPDFLYMAGLGVDGANLIQAMQALDYRPPGEFFMWDAPGPLLAASDNALSVSLFEEHEPFLSNPGADVMVELFKEAAAEADLPFQAVETQASASWAAWQVLTTAVEAVGSLDQEEIANWLLENEVETVIGTLFFDPEENNYGNDLTKIKQIIDGRWVVVWPPEFAAEGVSVNYSSVRD